MPVSLAAPPQTQPKYPDLHHIVYTWILLDASLSFFFFLTNYRIISEVINFSNDSLICFSQAGN